MIERIAIVGLGGLFPGATDLDGFWQNIVTRHDPSREPSPDRWLIPATSAYDPRPGTPDKVYSRRGYFLDPLEPDCTGLDLEPGLLAQLDPLYALALHVGNQAFRSARMEKVDRSRVGVILGSLALPTDSVSTLARAYLADQFPAFRSQGDSGNVHALNRQVTGLPAALLANALHLGGEAYTLDAACASSLYAVKLAADALFSGRADAMLAGGVSRPDCLYTQMGFSQLRALSLSGRCSPFDAAADGLVVGEGAGIFVLKRLSDAVRQGDTIHGVLAGWGLSNDLEGNLLAPASEGQLRAMKQAYRHAGWSPAEVDFIECHATGTPIGDAVEFESLRQLCSSNVRAWVIGSVKSTVGHCLTAAGAAGILKTVLALRHETLPPTANFRRPADKLHYERSRLRILGSPQPWLRRASGIPRRAAVSGFGFGGINAHLLIEEWIPDPQRTDTAVQTVPLASTERGLAIVGMAIHLEPWQNLEAFRTVLLDPKPSDASLPGKLEKLSFPVSGFAIPPNELSELLPQQLLMLQIADAALRQLHPHEIPTNLRRSVLLGLNLDLNTTNFHLRWWLQQQYPGQLAPELETALPPLTSARTMGGLASIAASRIARVFRSGEASFTISSVGDPGLQALALAMDALRNGEIDEAVVGAVDLATDPRAQKSQAAQNGKEVVARDGAVALVLKRLDDAVRDGNQIYTRLDRLPEERQSTECKFPELGNLGCCSGLVEIVAASLSLHERILPGQRYWLHDRSEGPRAIQLTVNNPTKLELSEFGEPQSRFDPLSIRNEWLIAFQGDDRQRLESRCRRLLAELQEPVPPSLETVARRCWQETQGLPTGGVRAAVVARDREELRSQLAALTAIVANPSAAGAVLRDAPQYRDRIFCNENAEITTGNLAFVYPGSGNHFPDMGREFGVLFPEILHQQGRENQFLRSQYAADFYWGKDRIEGADARTLLFAQVSVGTLVSDLLAKFGIRPEAMIGYSLGESAGLFGTRTWQTRDQMYQRMQESTLFTTDLAPPFNAARTQWKIAADAPLVWTIGVVALGAEQVQAAIPPDAKAFVLIINAADECVIGGNRPDVEALVQRLNAPYWELDGVTTAHCEAALPVRAAYRALHHLPTTPHANLRYYSGAWGHAYEMTADNAADSILAGVLGTIDFPRVIEAAYRDGVRQFVEIGPGGSCTRLISKILGQRPHVARALCVPRQDNYSLLLRFLGQRFVAGTAVDLSPIFPEQPVTTAPVNRRELILPVGLRLPDLAPHAEPQPTIVAIATPSEPLSIGSGLVAESLRTQGAIVEAHEAFLRLSTTTQTNLSRTLAWQTTLLQQWVEQGDGAVPSFVLEETTPKLATVPRALNREQCQAYAVGSIASVLGPRYAEVDRFPTRVRLPDGPLMLVDRILAIEGEPQSLGSGRVVTEHAVHSERWYLDSGRIPTCVAVEAGQADLFLSGFLGIDLQTKGLAVYRLLDAAVTFHRPLPGVGAVIHYDIHIDRFFRQGNTHLFRFRFEGTVDGDPLLSMTEGCAGFFSAEELASGKGIVHTGFDRRLIPGKRPADWVEFAPLKVEAYTASQVDALRQGDPAQAFGPEFANLNLRHPMRLPSGMLRLVQRVTQVEPMGGRYGLGLIRAEADIRPDDWFLTCHFVDDKVMPGTLMYECCLHTLRIFLMRMGWIGEEGEVHCEPVPGITSKLKCRGQVTASTQTVTYQVSIKELGYGPEPFVICDALMDADGKPIVEITNMSLRMAGLSKEKLQAVWAGKSGSGTSNPVARRPLFDADRILAFAIGKPSEAFGEPYRVFDSERKIARLPGPPFQFLDRITAIQGEPWKMVAGAIVEAEYDVPADAWYFAANRSSTMPFSVLLEIALQPCGWLAGYLGSALCSPEDMSFRNLGGTATQFMAITPDIGTLTTTVKITRVSNSGGMIIQHYDYAVRCRGRDVYVGNTYFGFFSKAALQNQIGLREASLYAPGATVNVMDQAGTFPQEVPFPDSMFRMVNRIKWWESAGGPKGLGALEGCILVDPEFWFFQAHFYEDPVWPGSLGLESFLQLLKYFAWKRWGSPSAGWQTVAVGKPHTWTYRGQVIPTDREVTVQAAITAIDDGQRWLQADGYLSVDGRIIYQMKDFTLQG